MGRGFAVIILMLITLSAAHAAMTDDQRLAVLAANMQQLATSEYALNCGPVTVNDNVANSFDGDVKGPRYCILKNNDQIIFGTLMQVPTGAIADYGALAQPILAGYDDFAPHVKPADLPDDLKTACKAGESTDTFWPCQEISTDYDTLYPYVYVDEEPEGNTIYMLVSEKEITAFEPPTLLGSITAFFRNLFGSAPSATFTDAPEYSAFHHAYFSHNGTRNISATWYSKTATIVYQGFVTDLSVIDHKEYELGSEGRQRLTFTMSSPQDTPRWKKLTSGFKVTDVAGTPKGAVCGDGVINGFDEECEGTNVSGLSCKDFGFGGGTLKCKATTCKFDTSGCTCIDADHDGFNLSGTSCGTQVDCNDTNASIYPNAIDWCGTKAAENCTIPNWNMYIGKDGPNCKTVPPPPLVCNYNGTCDAGETSDCRDCTTASGTCASVPQRMITQGYYNISVRANTLNQPELVISTKNASCKLNDEYTLIKGTTPGEIVVFQDANGYQMIITTTATSWNVSGNASKTITSSGALKSCWNTAKANGEDFKFGTKINDVSSCTERSSICVPVTGSCIVNSDCCGYDDQDSPSWCGTTNTCRQVRTRICPGGEPYPCSPDYRYP